MKEKRYCPYCRADITAEQKFCGNCGKKIPEVPIATVVEEHPQLIPSSDEASGQEYVQQPTNPIVPSPEKKSNNTLVFSLVAVILILLVGLMTVMSRKDESESKKTEIIVDNNADNNVDTDVSEYDEFQSDDEFQLDNEEYMAYGFYDVACGRLLDEQDIADCTKGELRIMRGWIYARHGYIFKSQDLRDYFSKIGWYEPRYSDVSSLLSDVEKKNVEFLKHHK